MKLSEDLAWRRLIKDKTFTANSWLDKSQTFYHGVDPSADSLHIGNLAAMITARRLIDRGWGAVLLVGGATSLVGDPGGKTEERELIKREVIKTNIQGIKSQIEKIFAGQEFALVDNHSWFKEIKYLDFLREYGKRFSMTELMQREFVTERIGEGGSGLSYAEFSYGLVQGYDFLRLNDKEVKVIGEDVERNLNVVLQIGGSDQWGNMLMGVSMIRKKANKEAHAFSIPLVINKSTGHKFGKSESGTVWLDANKTTVFKFYQFWINVNDDEVEDYLKIFTLLPREEIEHIMHAQSSSPADRIGQNKLANEITTIVHGKDQTEKARNATEVVMGSASVSDVSESVLAVLKEEVPNKKIMAGTPLVEILVKTGLASSNSEARRLLQGNAVYVNNEAFNRDHLESGDFIKGRLMLRRGKAYKDSALIELA